MKKVFSLLAVLALVCMASSAWAAVSLTKASIANFSSQGEITLNFTFKAISDDSTKDNIEWDVEHIALKQENPSWTTATVYAEISATITKANGAIYMYQNNTDSNSVYKSTAPRTESDGTKHSGMVNKVTQGGEYRGFVPMVYQITATKETPNFGSNPTNVSGTRYFSDQADSTYVANGDYITIANVGGLVDGYNANGTLRNIGNSGYMYFGGLFKNIYGGDEWGTDRIKIVSSAE